MHRSSPHFQFVHYEYRHILRSTVYGCRNGILLKSEIIIDQLYRYKVRLRYCTCIILYRYLVHVPYSTSSVRRYRYSTVRTVYSTIGSLIVHGTDTALSPLPCTTSHLTMAPRHVFASINPNIISISASATRWDQLAPRSEYDAQNLWFSLILPRA